MPPAKRQKLDNGADSTQVLSTLGQQWVASGLFKGCRTEQPFPSIEIDGLFNQLALSRVRKQLLEETTYTPRTSDLFSYTGTDDLLDVPAGSPVAQLRDCLYSRALTSYFGNLLNVRLSHKTRPDLSSHIYRPGDFLACHDDDVQDEAEGRRIAFILYLTKDWTEADGGALCLFGIDRTGYPSIIQHRISPAFGRLALFEVSSISYHEVSEVTGARDRLSISGWFRGPLRCRAQLAPLSTAFESSVPATSIIRSNLLDVQTASTLRESFAAEGHLLISDALSDEALAKLQEAARDALRGGKAAGPASARRYTFAMEDPSLAFFRSESFKEILATWTGLQVTTHRVMFRGFARGDYTLLHDEVQDAPGLDVLLSLQSAVAANGGTVRYVLDATAVEEVGADEPLLSIPPSSNTLVLVLRDQKTLKYVERVRRETETDWQRIDLDGLYELAVTD